MRWSRGYLTRNSDRSCLAALKSLRPVLFQGQQVLRVDHPLLHVAPLRVGRVLGQVLAPHLDGLGELGLIAVRLAQQHAGLGNRLGRLVPRVGQQLGQLAHRVFVTSPRHVAQGDVHVSLGRQFVRGEFCQKGFQGRDAEFQVRVGGGLGQPPGARQLEAGFGDPRRRRIGMRGQQGPARRAARPWVAGPPESIRPSGSAASIAKGSSGVRRETW